MMKNMNHKTSAVSKAFDAPISTEEMQRMLVGKTVKSALVPARFSTLAAACTRRYSLPIPCITIAIRLTS